MTTEEPKCTDGRTLRHQHRRPQLLAALTDYVLENGIYEMSLRQASDAVGVTHATLIRHFKSKDALIHEIITTVRVDLLSRFNASVSGQPSRSTAEHLLTLWELLCEPIERRQFLLLFELAGRDGRDTVRRSLLPTPLFEEFLRPISEQLVADGQAPDHAEVIASAILAQIRGLQLELAITGNRERVDAAMTLFVSRVVP